MMNIFHIYNCSHMKDCEILHIMQSLPSTSTNELSLMTQR